jgi:hypothetical protein
LHPSVGVGEGPFFLGPAARGQKDVGQSPRLVDEEVLHNEEIQAAQTLFRVVQVGFAHHGVLAHDIHRPDAPRACGLDDLRRRQT